MTAERAELERKHALLIRLVREHQRRSDALRAQIQPTLRRMWEIDHPEDRPGD